LTRAFDEGAADGCYGSLGAEPPDGDTHAGACSVLPACFGEAAIRLNSAIAPSRSFTASLVATDTS